MAYVYLIRHAMEPRFKIGKSKHPIKRSSAFRESLDYDNSLQIRVGGRALGLEKGLHALFDNFRLPPVSDCDGATEWFRLECWDQCLLFLKQHQDLIGAVPEPIPMPTPKEFVVLTGEERTEYKRRNQEIKCMKNLRENLARVELWEKFPQWLAAQEIAAEKISKYGNLDISIPGISFEEARLLKSSKIGWSGLVIENSAWACGVVGMEWCEDGQILTIMLSQLPTGAIEQMHDNDIDPILQARIQIMQNWITRRTGRAKMPCV